MLPYIVACRAAGQPPALAVEVNANLPYMPGAAEMDVGECDVVLETERPHYALFAPPKEPVSLHDYAMGPARGDAHQGRRHAADRHRFVLGCIDACADLAPHAQR
jgi:hypothetical protein